MATFKGRMAAGLALVIFTGVSVAQELSSWPDFPPEVIEAARQRYNAEVPKPRKPERRIIPSAQDITPTREGILEAIAEHHHQLPPKEVRKLGEPALEVLLSILADESLSPRYHVQAIRLLVPFGLEQDTGQDQWRSPSIVLQPRSKDAARISDAVTQQFTAPRQVLPRHGPVFRNRAPDFPLRQPATASLHAGPA
ncbi:MAG: hypothetical protein JSU63_05985 [Phycisphaerales bacterium]|nr:MAG: hypothetical protein JSU63_05985 [Phycisphaerales bacterium]